MNIEVLEKVFNEAKEGQCCICVEVTIPGQNETELIINKFESLDNKLEYYKKTYDENLVHKNCSDIKILSAIPINFMFQSNAEDEEIDE